MIVKDGTNPKIEKHKTKLGLVGDVYIVQGHYIETLESHKTLIPTSTATTLEEAIIEREALLEEQRLERERLAQEEYERMLQEQEDEGEEE